MASSNTSLNTLPQFSSINAAEIEANTHKILTEGLETIKSLIKDGKKYSWENLIQPLEDIDDRLHRSWSLVSHLNSVVNTPELREAYNACIPKLSAYSTEISQNEELYNAFVAISESSEFAKLDIAQRTAIEHSIRDFKLSGVHLNKTDKMLFADLVKELSQLTTKFEENVLDATDGWSKLITEESELSGLPDFAKDAAKQAAQKKDQKGWLLSLEMPCYHAVITYADSQKLREEIYRAFSTRASEIGPNAGKWDNTKVMRQILKTRHQIATLIGYHNFAEKSIIPKMADNTAEVMSFLEELAEKSYPKAVEEFTELHKFVVEEFDLDDVNAWDIPYYSEKLRKRRYAISQQELRPYFPEDQVLNGLFEVIKRLYGISVKEQKDFDRWHPDVRLFDLIDDEGNLRAHCYIDLYARANKRGGAWMDDCRTRRVVNGKVQLPIAFVTCNFNSPVGNDPALFTHDEVLTLFHEFGHALHHMLTKVDYSDVSGINGVPWDAVELPSQFFENWCWDKDVLNLISKHYKTGESLPNDLFEKMLAAKNFQSAMQMARQLEFALFDFRLHMEFDEDEPNQVQKILDEVREDICVVPIPEFNRFANGFSHIFAGGYAAGYYSYKWAEVLSADAFSKFEERGIFDETTGREFLHNILEKGGSEKPKQLFINFRGREPKIDALLRHSGISTQETL